MIRRRPPRSHDAIPAQTIPASLCPQDPPACHSPSSTSVEPKQPASVARQARPPPAWSEPRGCRRGTCLSRASSGSGSAIHSPGCYTRHGQPNVSRDEVAAGRLEEVGRGRPLGARHRDRIERAAPLVVVALRHFAPQGEKLAVLSHLHEDTPHAERTELVRDRASRVAVTSGCLRHRATLSRVELTVRSEAAWRPLHGLFGRGDVCVQVPTCWQCDLGRTWRCSLCLEATARWAEAPGGLVTLARQR